MPRRKGGFLEVLGRWEQLSANMARHEGALPHLAELRADLDRLVAEGRQLVAEAQVLDAARQTNTRRRKDVETLGHRASGRLGAALRAEHGFNSERLVEFGLRPNRGGRPRKRPVSPPEPETAEPGAGGE